MFDGDFELGDTEGLSWSARWYGRAARWEDALVSFMRCRGRWVDAAKDSERWKAWEDEFAQAGLEQRAS